MLLPRDFDDHPIQALRPGTTQTAAYSGTSAAIADAVAAGTRVVRVVATSDCHLAFGAAPTATTSDPLLPATTAEYFAVQPGDKLAAVQAAAAGTLYVTEMG